MNDLQLLSMISNFPIGDAPKNREELLSKAKIVSFLSRFQKQFSSIENVDEVELIVQTLLSETLALENEEVLPSISQAERNLKLSPDFLHDYNKIQSIQENNPDFDKTYDMIASNLELNDELHISK